MSGWTSSWWRVTKRLAPHPCFLQLARQQRGEFAGAAALQVVGIVDTDQDVHDGSFPAAGWMNAVGAQAAQHRRHPEGADGAEDHGGDGLEQGMAPDQRRVHADQADRGRRCRRTWWRRPGRRPGHRGAGSPTARGGAGHRGRRPGPAAGTGRSPAARPCPCRAAPRRSPSSRPVTLAAARKGTQPRASSRKKAVKSMRARRSPGASGRRPWWPAAKRRRNRGRATP